MKVPDAAKHGRNLYEVDIFRKLLLPVVDGRLQLVAVRAAVPEQLNHFDFIGLGGGDRVVQNSIVLPSDQVVGHGVMGSQAAQGKQGGKRSEERRVGKAG